jgi:DNA modification methylase
MTDLPVNRILVGDSAEVLKTFPADSIDAEITSPPYDKAREYKKGSAFNFEGIAVELYRVLKPGGSLVWVAQNMIREDGQGETNTVEDQTKYFTEKVGFWKWDTMIYSKDARYPEDFRYRQSWEYMIHFTKGKPKTTNLLRDHRTVSYYVHKWRRNHATNRQEDGTTSETRDYNVHPFQTRENIWYFQNGFMKSTKDKIAFDHPAIFPDALAEDHVLSWTNPGDIVLDPFAGSGTTLKAAAKHRRQWIGIEIAEEYATIARKRLEKIEQNTTLTDLLGG